MSLKLSKKSKVIVFDKTGGCCGYCDILPSRSYNTCYDHMLPKSKGGKDKAENIIISCRRCNTMKRDMLMNEFLEYAMIRLYKCVGEYMALIEKRHNRIRRDGKNDTYAQKLLEKRYPVQNDITYFTRIISNLPEYL